MNQADVKGPPVKKSASSITKRIMKPLSVQVLLGRRARHRTRRLCSGHRRVVQAAWGQLRQAAQDADRADHPHDGRRGHRQNRRREKPRPHWLEGATVVRGRNYLRAADRTGCRQGQPAGCWHECGPAPIGCWCGGRVREGYAVSRANRVPPALHPRHLGRELRRRGHTSGRVALCPIQSRLLEARTAWPPSAGRTTNS